jgi:GH24 family phage-related lysozyme (muramidase)
VSTIFSEEGGSPLYDRAMREKSFSSYVREAEGRRVDKKGRHIPFTGPAGYKLIGYGHRIMEGEKFTNLTEEGARELLRKDMGKAKLGAMRTHGTKWTLMSERDQNIATDMAFTLGNFGYDSTYPKLQKALETRDEEGIQREAIRGHYPKGDKSKGLQPMNRRDRLFKRHFFDNGPYGIRVLGR